jgi:tetratricopeptide (TPR) repeat protein
MNARAGRNDPCPCGSRRKFKHCCGALSAAPSPAGLQRGQVGALVALIDRGRPADAEREVRGLLRSHPDAGMLWKVLSVALMRQGKDALEPLQRAVELLPADAEAHANLGSELSGRGRQQEALASFERSLELEPRASGTLIDAANTLRALGRGRESLALYERALCLEPRSAETHNNLGSARLELGQAAAAVDSYRAALQLRPEDAAIQCNLASALHQQGSYQEALESSQRAIAREPGLSAAYNHQGLALAALGRRREAIASLRRAVALHGGYFEALANLAELLREVGERHESLELWQKVIELDPRRAASHCQLGRVLFELRQLEPAVASFRRALELEPRELQAQLGIAAALRVLGRHAEAEERCQAALALAPASVEGLALLGELRADRGQFAEAQQLFGRALALDADYPSLYSSIATHRRMTAEDAAWLAGVQRLLARQLPLANEIGLRFALAKFYDDTARYDEAFENYRLANELTARDGARYEPGKLTARVSELMQRFDAAGIATLQQHAADSARPVFIIGMPRSGTSLTEQIIASHPLAFGAGEVRFWDRAFTELRSCGTQEAARAARAEQLTREYLTRLGGGAGSALRITDKMPANFLYAGLIHALFPQARIIHLQRHPLDTCLSIYFQNFFNMATYGRDLGNLAHYYGEYQRIMAHWQAVLPADVLLTVPYEALVQDQEGWTRRMLEFIGLPWDARCLEFQETERVVITASRWQVRQRITNASVGRWRNYRKHLAPLMHLLPAEGN